MQYVESQTLADVLSATGPISPIDAARIGLDLLDALEAAHAVGVLHRDVKPGNVLLDPRAGRCLTDFGIATIGGDDTLTEHGVLVGSPSYIAPERVRGEDAGPFADLWSLGATLYAAVEGRGPFDRGEAMATLLAVTTEPPTPPERAGQLAPVLLGLLEKEPEQRMPGWAARNALRAFVDEASRPLPPPPRVPPPTHPPPVGAPASPMPGSPSAGAPTAGSPTSGSPSTAPPDSVAKLNRDDIAKLAAMAGKSFAKGAARAAVAGLSAWQDKAASSTSPAGPAGPARLPVLQAGKVRGRRRPRRHVVAGPRRRPPARPDPRVARGTGCAPASRSGSSTRAGRCSVTSP